MDLSKKDQERINTFYSRALEMYGGEDPRSVQWTDTHNQLRRFAALTYVDTLNESRVLDVGCGTGDLYDFLYKQHIHAEYTGIDIVPDMIAAAKRKFPETDFREASVFDIEESFDFVLASGVMSFKVADHESYYQDMIKAMYERAGTAVAFNMLDRKTHPDTETYATYDPKEIVDLCGSFAVRVEVATDYLPQDFTVYLYKS